MKPFLSIFMFVLMLASAPEAVSEDLGQTAPALSTVEGKGKIVIQILLPEEEKHFDLVITREGRPIRTFSIPPLPGNHTILWDGKDDQGTSLSSGLYAAELREGKIVLESREIILQQALEPVQSVSKQKKRLRK